MERGGFSHEEGRASHEEGRASHGEGPAGWGLIVSEVQSGEVPRLEGTVAMDVPCTSGLTHAHTREGEGEYTACTAKMPDRRVWLLHRARSVPRCTTTAGGARRGQGQARQLYASSNPTGPRASAIRTSAAERAAASSAVASRLSSASACCRAAASCRWCCCPAASRSAILPRS